MEAKASEIKILLNMSKYPLTKKKSYLKQLGKVRHLIPTQLIKQNKIKSSYEREREGPTSWGIIEDIAVVRVRF